jgi:hypothetical protein
MTKRIIAPALLIACMALPFLMRPAHATPYYDSTGLERLCRSNNGTFLPPTIDSPAYGCLATGGGSVVCGGKKGTKYEKTCSVGRWKMKTIRKRNRGRG